MARANAKEEIYEGVEIFGYPMIFTDSRIDRNSVPEGMFMYEVRHEDIDWGNIAQLGKGILVNFFGTVISDREVDLPDKTEHGNAYREVDDEKDVNWLGTDVSLDEYMNRDRPKERDDER